MDKFMNSITNLKCWGDCSYGLLTGMLIYLVGGKDKAMVALLIFIVLDYITGVLKGIIKGNLKSKYMFLGLLKKMLILAMIIIANQIDIIFAGEVSTRFAVICFYIGNEGLSILENLVSLGIPIPNKIKRILEQCKDDEKKG